jgi:ribose transport system permease protein
MNKDGVLSRIVKSLALPLVLFVIFGSISAVTGNSFLTVRMMLYTMKLTCVTLVIAIAINFQIRNGGFDFSIGAIVYLSAIIGGVIATKNRYSPYTMALIIIGAAVMLTMVNAVLYIILRLPPMIVSLITLMIYEAITQIYNDGKGIMITTKPAYAVFYREPLVFIVTAFMMLFFWALMKYTRFGFQSRALANGQRTAVDFGINEISNVVKRYAIVGIFLGVAALLYLGRVLTVEAAQNMVSTIVMFQAIMPGMIGGVLAKYSNIPVGIFLASVSMQFIDVGFVCMGMDSNLASAVSGLFILAFIGLSGNLPQIMKGFDRKKLREQLIQGFNARTAE